MFVDDAIALMQRADSAARRLGACIIAGDTKEASEINIITCGIGRFLKGKQMGRRGARPGDLVVVTGELGLFTGAHLGFHMGLTRAELDARLLQPVFAPMPADQTALSLLASVNPTAGMDLSDGLLSAAFALAECNDLGITLRQRDIPLAPAAAEMARRFSVDPLRMAFGTGDWQIMYAIDPMEWQRLAPTEAIRTHVVPIGEFTSASGEIWLTCNDGRRRQLRRIEQQHFLETWADGGFLDYLVETPLFM
jgi:thiamine-monophosphate kinase